MLERRIIHIGRQKSGTSAIQRVLHLNRDPLSRLGICYPATVERSIAHHDVARACDRRTGGAEGRKKAVEAIAAALRADTRTLILSSEAFQNLGDLEPLREVLGAFPARQTLIVCYVREFVDYNLSSFRQAVQHQSVPLLLSDRLSRPIDAAAFLRRWEDVGEVALRWYDRARLRNGDAVEDFFDAAGLSDVLPSLPNRTVEANPSIGGNLLFLKAAANHAGLPWLSYAELEALAKEHAAFRTGFHFASGRAAALRADNAFNDVLAARLGPPRFKDWSDLPPVPDHATLSEDVERIRARHPDAALSGLVDMRKAAEAWF